MLKPIFREAQKASMSYSSSGLK